jgi:hypothetical protein
MPSEEGRSGRGLVDACNDFGASGKNPASQFVHFVFYCSYGRTGSIRESLGLANGTIAAKGRSWRMTRKAKVSVKGTEITVLVHDEQDYISLTDIARYKDADRTDYLISNWMRNRNTIEFLGIWEALNNPNFNPIEFDGIKRHAGLNSFILTAKQWVDKTGAIGLLSKPGRYGGTFAHRDIAFEFAIRQMQILTASSIARQLKE